MCMLGKLNILCLSRISYEQLNVMMPLIANSGCLNIGIDWDSKSSIQNLYYLLYRCSTVEQNRIVISFTYMICIVPPIQSLALFTTPSYLVSIHKSKMNTI